MYVDLLNWTATNPALNRQLTAMLSAIGPEGTVSSANKARLHSFARGIIEEGDEITGLPETEDCPGVGVIIGPFATMVMVSGSTNTQLRSMVESWQGVGVDSLGIGDLPVWGRAARSLITLLRRPEIEPLRDYYLVGHSAGGAIATVLGAELIEGYGCQRVKIWSYGAPKPGSPRLAQILRLTSVCRVYNAEDPVPYLPPQSSDSPTLTAIYPRQTIDTCNSQVQPPTGYALSLGGVLVRNEGNQPPAAVMMTSLTQWALSGSGGFSNGYHAVQYYNQRFALGEALPQVGIVAVSPNPVQTIETLTTPQRESIIRIGESLLFDDSISPTGLSANYRAPARTGGRAERYYKRKVGSRWGVFLRGELVISARNKKSATRAARHLNRQQAQLP